MNNSGQFTNHYYKLGLTIPVLGFGIAAGLSGANPACSTERPNIIVILADDLGYGDIGSYGSSIHQTPVLDKMAAEGISFMDYYSNGPVSTPTRAALITGNYQQRAGLEGVIYVAIDQRSKGMSDSEKTMAEFFSEAGYNTGIFGKWHLGFRKEHNPTFFGFDKFVGFKSGNVDYISHHDNLGLHDWWHNLTRVYEEGYLTDLITDHALDFMERNRDEPFFIYITHLAPHTPYQGRDDKADRYPGEKFSYYGSRSDRHEAYKEMVEIMDENIGRVFEKLKELGLEYNTFVFFCSDNGANEYGSNGNLNGFKTTLWEGGIRVPAIGWYPKKIQSGIISNSQVISMDILPTILSIAKIETSYQFDGHDFSEVMFSQKELEERPFFWRYRGQWAVRKGYWKYLRIKDEEYLFNLKDDIQESNNLIDDHPDKMLELKKYLAEWEDEMDKYIQQTD